MKIFTIGFTQKKADKFFGLLKDSGAKRLIDVRLNNVSQLAGFAKRDDLKYFLENLCDMEYMHIPELAPTKNILDDYKKKKIIWDDYEKKFLELMENRRIEKTLKKDLLDGSCLLCSEKEPHHCHRRSVAEYLRKHWDEEIEIKHLV